MIVDSNGEPMTLSSARIAAIQAQDDDESGAYRLVHYPYPDPSMRRRREAIKAAIVGFTIGCSYAACLVGLYVVGSITAVLLGIVLAIIGGVSVRSFDYHG